MKFIDNPKGFLPYYMMLSIPFLVIFSVIPSNLYYNQMNCWAYNINILLLFFVGGIILYGLLLFLGRPLFYTRPHLFKRLAFGLFYIGLYLLLSSVYTSVSDSSFRGTNQIDPGLLTNTIIELAILLGISLMAFTAKHEMKVFLGVITSIAVVTMGLVYLVLIFTVAVPSSAEHLSGNNQSQRNIQGNVYHFVLDQMQTDAVLRFMKEEKAKGEFNGFIFFENNYSNYLLTSASVNSFMTGSIYHGGVYLNWRNEFRQKGLLRDLHQKGYSISMYFPWNNWFQTELASNSREIYTFFNDQRPENTIVNFSRMWLAELIPDFLARKFLEQTDSLTVPQNYNEGYLTYASQLMLKTLIAEEKDRQPDGQYLYIHPLLPHDPYVFTKNGRYDLRVARQSNEGYYSQSVFTLKLVIQYLNELKRLNRYNNSTIIIQSDHGAPTGVLSEQDWKSAHPPINGTKAERFLGNKEGWTENQVKSRARALLMIKPAKRGGMLFISRQPSQLIDLYPTLVGLLNLNPSMKNVKGIPLFGNIPQQRGIDFYVFLPDLLDHDHPNRITRISVTNPTNIIQSKLEIRSSTEAK